MTASSKKLSATSRQVVLLRQWFASGKLVGDEPPAIVQSMSPVFAGYKVDNFRRAYNRLKKEYGSYSGNANCQDGNQTTELKRRCSDDTEDPDSKKNRIETVSDDDEDESEAEFVSESQLDLKSFKPIYLLSSWVERHTTTKRLSIAVCLLSGVNCGDYTIRVLSGGLILEMRCVWPNEFCNIERLHRKWLEGNQDRLEPYHPKLSGFDNFLKLLRKRNTDAVEQVARIPLPFAVESHIHAIYNLAWRDSTTRAVYLELRASVEEYGVKNGNSSFEII